jgi:HK97 gp10 family phage protein
VIRVHTDGFKQLQQALSELPKATQTAVLKRAVTKSAAPLVEAARSNAPVDSGQLRKSIKAVAQSTGGAAGKRAFAQAMAAGASRAEAGAAARAANSAARAGRSVSVKVGPAGGARHYAHLVEYGYSKRAANPWFRPAWAKTKGEVFANMAGEIRTEISKAAARIAARAAKKAAAGR